MTLPISPNSISLSQVAVELGRASNATTSLGESAVRDLAGIASGTISLSSLYGKSSVIKIGYLLGGYKSEGKVGYTTTIYLSNIDKLNFTTENTSSTSATLATARYGQSGVNSGTRGYGLGGYNGAYVTEIDGIQFDNETAINPAAALTTACMSQNAGWSSTQKGYSPGNTPLTVSKHIGIVFSNETFFSLSVGLAVVRTGVCAVASSTRGYAMGGYYINPYPPIPTYYIEIDGLEFSTETQINPSAALSSNAIRAGAVNSSSRGYRLGGANDAYGSGASVTEVEGIRFDTEAAINPAAALSTGRDYAVSLNSSTKGYVLGGAAIISSYVYAYNSIEGIQFDTETVNSLSAVLNTGKAGGAGVQPYGNNP